MVTSFCPHKWPSRITKVGDVVIARVDQEFVHAANMSVRCFDTGTSTDGEFVGGNMILCKGDLSGLRSIEMATS